MRGDVHPHIWIMFPLAQPRSGQRQGIMLPLAQPRSGERQSAKPPQPTRSATA
jgi:hypothetical protein